MVGKETEPPDEGLEGTTPAEAPVPARARHRPLVMMVEDDPDDRRIYGTVLCYNGFDVLLVPDGASAIRFANEYRPDLVVLDLGLPDVNGLEICQDLVGPSDGVGVPVIVLSGFPKRATRARALEAGCLEYIEKPTSPVQVLHKVEEILGRPPAPGDGDAPRIIP